MRPKTLMAAVNREVVGQLQIGGPSRGGRGIHWGSFVSPHASQVIPLPIPLAPFPDRDQARSGVARPIVIDVIATLLAAYHALAECRCEFGLRPFQAVFILHFGEEIIPRREAESSLGFLGKGLCSLSRRLSKLAIEMCLSGIRYNARRARCRFVMSKDGQDGGLKGDHAVRLARVLIRLCGAIGTFASLKVLQVTVPSNDLDCTSGHRFLKQRTDEVFAPPYDWV